MNYLTDIKPLEDAGQTDEQIVASLQLTQPQHKRNCMATSSKRGETDLRHLLLNKFKLVKGDSGPLVEARDAVKNGLASFAESIPSIPVEQRATYDELIVDGIERLLNEFEVTDREVYARDDPQTGQLTTIICGICDGLVGSNAVSEAVFNLTGGPIWADLTVEQIQEERQLYLDRQNDPRERWAAGVQAGALVNERDGTILESVQALIDAAGLTCTDLSEA